MPAHSGRHVILRALLCVFAVSAAALSLNYFGLLGTPSPTITAAAMMLAGTSLLGLIAFRVVTSSPSSSRTLPPEPGRDDDRAA